MAIQARYGLMPRRGPFDEPCKKNPRNKTKAQGNRGRSNDNANDSTNVLGEVADIEIPDGRRVYEASHGQPRRHARCEDVHLCGNRDSNQRFAIWRLAEPVSTSFPYFHEEKSISPFDFGAHPCHGEHAERR